MKRLTRDFFNHISSSFQHSEIKAIIRRGAISAFFVCVIGVVLFQTGGRVVADNFLRSISVGNAPVATAVNPMTNKV